MIRSILYATDLGLYASYVLQHALAMSRSFKADLYVVHAVEPMGLFAESVLQTYLDVFTHHYLQAKHQLPPDCQGEAHQRLAQALGRTARA